MKYCAVSESTTSARLVIQTDPAVTCEAMGGVDWQLPIQFLPSMSFAEGLIVGAGIVTAWLIGYGVRKAINLTSRM